MKIQWWLTVRGGAGVGVGGSLVSCKKSLKSAFCKKNIANADKKIAENGQNRDFCENFCTTPMRINGMCAKFWRVAGKKNDFFADRQASNINHYNTFKHFFQYRLPAQK